MSTNSGFITLKSRACVLRRRIEHHTHVCCVLRSTCPAPQRSSRQPAAVGRELEDAAGPLLLPLVPEAYLAAGAGAAHDLHHDRELHGRVLQHRDPHSTSVNGVPHVSAVDRLDAAWRVAATGLPEGGGGGRTAAAKPASPAPRRAAASSQADARRFVHSARRPGGCSLHRAAHGEPPLAWRSGA